MNHSAGDPLQSESDYVKERDWIRSPRTVALLARLDEAIEKAVTADDIQLRVMALHLIRRGGKRLRPALLILCGTLGTGSDDRLLQAAAALELVHVASLYHDDIMDRASLRRGGPSTNARWGNPPATFAGTYLFSRACELWAALGQDANDLASRTAVDVCRGQLTELEHSFDTEIDEDTHLRILALKTASLFALPCQMGAILSELPTTFVNTLMRFGNDLGLAFQLVDDVLDLTGDTERIGKVAGKDLREGIYSLPVLRALHSDTVGDQLLDLLMKVNLDDDDVRDAVALVQRSGTIDYARDLINRYVEEAISSLAVLPDGPTTDSLRALAHLVVHRTA